MKRFGRFALFFAGGLLVLLLGALLAVNLYVQSKGTQARIQEELSARLGAPLHIQRISVTPWWGLKLTGITMPQTEPGAPGEFLRADTFRLRIRFVSLFSGRLVIKEISLIKPTVLWAQNADGQWRLPSATFTEEPEAHLDAAPGAVPVETVPRVHSPPPMAAVPATEPAAFTPEVRRVNLSKGSFHFLDEKGKPVAVFDGVRFRSDFRTATELRGSASIKKIALRERFFLHELRSPLLYDPEALELSQIRAEVGGGELKGEFKMRQAEADSPFTAKVNFRDVQVDRIVSDAGGPAGMLQGRIEGHLNANGKTADANALAGSGEIFLREGEVRRYGLLVALGQLLQLQELEQLRLEEAHAKYHITPGVVTIDELLLSSPNIRLSATGTVSFKGQLRLASRLAINEKIRTQLFPVVRDKFQRKEADYAALDFEVTGTIQRPKTDLRDKLIGPELKDLGGIISALLGGGKAAPAPSPSPPNESPRPTATP